jgi:hypothetical protein
MNWERRSTNIKTVATGPKTIYIQKGEVQENGWSASGNWACQNIEVKTKQGP